MLTKEEQLFDQWRDAFVAAQNPLGEPFEKVLYDNLWELYEE